ncbi:MAG: single-stranded-DNA-specific exonuclease [Candidatus Peregrinibacteria bacterium Gr01-1014_25]|nr:MAG: single-stranded-DNA-specific exonuclease [Candidatus Peregrinibacteria bacterium Gr01-1014_25]
MLSSHDAVLQALLSLRGIDPTQETRADDAWGEAIETAATRMRAALDAGERIGIVGDYDCDGITSAAQLVRCCRRHGCEPTVLLPHRVRDGYGLHPSHVAACIDAGVGLLIAADTGVTALAAIEATRAGGMDVIILDHHALPTQLPNATAIVHPALAGLSEPHPSAAGIVYAFVRRVEGDTWIGEAEDRLLAALGTVADVVPLLGGNRALVRSALADIHRIDADAPLALLVQRTLGGNGPLTAQDIAYRIAPRINAAGRMDDPHIALRALLGDAAALDTLEHLNAARQEQTEALLQDCDAAIAGAHDQACVCIADARYPHGLLGLLAGKITERTGKPALVGTIHGGLCTASLRSPPGCDIIAVLRRCHERLLQGGGGGFSSVGGHARAAGCTFHAEHFADVADAVHADVDALLPIDRRSPACCADVAIDPRLANAALARTLSTLEPFGEGNPEPRFLLCKVTLEHARLVGGDGRHLQAGLAGIGAIGFGLGRTLPHLTHAVDVIARLGINQWNGKERAQWIVDDLRSAVSLSVPVATPAPVCPPLQTHPSPAR